MTAVIVRPAQEHDAPAIAAVQVRGWKAAYPGIVPQPVLDRMEDESYAERWHRGLTRPLLEDRTFVADDRRAVVGVVATGLCRDEDQPPGTAELFLIYVDPDRVGSGIGSELLRHAERDLADRGFARTILWVFEHNGRATRFYEAAGWTPDGASQDVDFDGEAVTEIRYVRELR